MSLFDVGTLEVYILTIGNVKVDILTVGNREVDILTLGNVEVDILTVGKIETYKITLQHCYPNSCYVIFLSIFVLFQAIDYFIFPK
jgi:hypothetical protein